VTNPDGWHRGRGGWALFKLGSCVALVEPEGASYRWTVALGEAVDRLEANPTTNGTADSPLLAMEHASVCWSSFCDRAVICGSLCADLHQLWASGPTSPAPALR